MIMTQSAVPGHSNPSPPLPSSLINFDILSNLTKLIIVAKLRTINEEGVDEDTDDVELRQPQTRPFSYSSPLPWLVARLRVEMLTPASNLSEIILQLNLSVTDNILKNIADTGLISLASCRPRLKSLPSLNLVTLKVSGQYTPLSPAQWTVLKHNWHLSPRVDAGQLVLVNRPIVLQ